MYLRGYILVLAYSEPDYILAFFPVGQKRQSVRFVNGVILDSVQEIYFWIF